MRAFILGTALALSAAPAAFAQTAPAPAAAPAAAKAYTTADTEIGTLLDDPASKAILDARLPGFSTNPQVEMARAMTLKSVQPYAPDMITDKVLGEIDADFAKLPVKK